MVLVDLVIFNYIVGGSKGNKIEILGEWSLRYKKVRDWDVVGKDYWLEKKSDNSFYWNFVLMVLFFEFCFFWCRI